MTHAPFAAAWSSRRVSAVRSACGVDRLGNYTQGSGLAHPAALRSRSCRSRSDLPLETRLSAHPNEPALTAGSPCQKAALGGS
eukprot:scaffold376_cov354-Prasinococcus_capsulatus_cf.AAC.1